MQTSDAWRKSLPYGAAGRSPGRNDLRARSRTGRCEGHRIPHDAAKAQVRSGGIYRLWKAGRRPVAAAVVRGAEMRATLEDLARNPDRRRAKIVAACFILPLVPGTAWGCNGRMARAVPVRGPLPHVPDHIVESVAIRRE